VVRINYSGNQEQMRLTCCAPAASAAPRAQDDLVEQCLSGYDLDG